MKSTKIALLATALVGGLVLMLALSVPSAEAAPKKCDNDPTARGCGGGGASIVYTAELTEGAFVFGPVDVTPNSKENQLFSSTDLNLDINDSLAPATWDQIFNTCGELLDPDSVDDFFVGDDDWRINKSGGVRVVFPNILFLDQGAEVTVQLIGNEFDFIDSFLPESIGDIRSYALTQGAIYGRTLKGTSPKMGCQPPGGGGFDVFTLLSPSTLVITAVAGD